ncbi:hypothetical protein OG698_46305 [Streptomyces sp. NBC_01003]|nr:hypothetical protein OG698_46305 [Streptomyces sp. NBC_01003]
MTDTRPSKRTVALVVGAVLVVVGVAACAVFGGSSTGPTRPPATSRPPTSQPPTSRPPMTEPPTSAPPCSRAGMRSEGDTNYPGMPTEVPTESSAPPGDEPTQEPDGHGREANNSALRGDACGDLPGEPLGFLTQLVQALRSDQLKKT